MHHRTSVLSLALILASSLVASNASATTANFSYKVCLIKSFFQEEGEDKVKQKHKFKRVVVEGLDSLRLTYNFNEDFQFDLATEVVNDRKRNVMVDDDLDGRRKVNKSFQKSVDTFDLRANITYDDGELRA